MHNNEDDFQNPDPQSQSLQFPPVFNIAFPGINDRLHALHTVSFTSVHTVAVWNPSPQAVHGEHWVSLVDEHGILKLVLGHWMGEHRVHEDGFPLESRGAV
jgi:hypothetical protein